MKKVNDSILSTHKHTIAVLVMNRAGVLARVSSLFARRGFNIDSLAVGPTDDENISRITIIVNGDNYIAGQLVKQLAKLIDVITVEKISDERVNSGLTLRELIIIKLSINNKTKEKIVEIATSMNAEIADISPETISLVFTGRIDKVDILLNLLKNYKILEIARTGSVALQKGASRLGK